MDLNYSINGIAQISMINYTTKIYTDFPKPITTSCATPAANHLFTVRDESKAKFLPEKQAQAFHHTFAQLLFLCKQTHRDIQTVVSFLTTRVKCPDKDGYLRGTRHMKLNLLADNLTTIQWWVDTSHAVHEHCKGHTGAMMSLGKGAIISFLNKQKINSKSSTESKLIGSNPALSSILHMRYFIKAQGYLVKQNILFHDNQSLMQLEVNGSYSSSKCMKHIKCRYFFIRDKIKDGDLAVQYSPTEIMWADVLTKPKQGGPFCLGRSQLMNIPINYNDDVEHLKTHPLLLLSEECPN
jgi:hypothetical protein